jgi:hypothetical protein
VGKTDMELTDKAVKRAMLRARKHMDKMFEPEGDWYQNAGYMPVPAEALVQVKLIGGMESKFPVPAGQLRWTITGMGSIGAYRVMKVRAEYVGVFRAFLRFKKDGVV